MFFNTFYYYSLDEINIYGQQLNEFHRAIYESIKYNVGLVLVLNKF